MSRRFIIGVFIFVFLFFAVSKTYACPGLPPTAFISGLYTKYACVGSDFTFEGDESHDNDDLPTTQCCIVNYSWSGGGTPSSQSGSNSSFTTKWDTTTEGDPHTINLTVTDNEGMTHSTSCTVYVVKVNNVTEDKTIACVLETVTFTAHAYPSGKALTCIDWQKHYRPPGSETWGDWETVDGGDNTAELKTGTAGYYQYRARNGPGDTWVEKESDEVTIYTVQTVQWETYPDDVVVPPPDPDHGPNLDLDGNPNTGGGRRIFPGKKCYDDTTAEAAMRRKVKVKATTTPVVDNRRVYFSWWDIDDPSTDDPPIDTNGSTGDDNNGSGESLSPTFEATNASGEARVTFTVAMQPGDNYKIAASINQTKLGEMTQPMADGQEGLPDTVVLSEEMLTTWRKLWIERDSMDDVATTGAEKDLTSSTITGLDENSYDSGSGITTLDVEDLYDYWDGADRLNGGKLAVGGHEYPIVDMYDTWGDETLDVQGNPYGDGVRVNDGCNLYDDDYKGNGVFEIDFPVRTYLRVIDKLMFQKAYIEPENLSSAYEDTVSFELNFHEIGDLTPDVTGSTSFWTVMVMNAFQPKAGNDEDPDSETGTAGLSIVQLVGDNPDKCAIYHETGREMIQTMSHYMAHEIGHTQNIGNQFFEHCSDIDCIMHDGATGYNFCDDCKNSLRERSTW